MLSLEEALLLRAAQEETEKQQSIQAATAAGAIGGSLLGAAGGVLPHELGKFYNRVTAKPAQEITAGMARSNPASRLGSRMRAAPKQAAAALRPGFRMAGGLTGAILGGALGAGTAAVMKHNNRPAQLLGEIQASGTLTENQKYQLGLLLGELYTEQARGM